MFNPGFIYLLAAVGLCFAKGKSKKWVITIASLLTLGSIYLIPEKTALKFDFLDFELIFYQVDSMRRFTGFIFAFFALGAIVYSLVTESKKFYPLTALYIGSAITLVFVGDFFSFYIFWELMTISSFFLIYNNQNPIIKKTSYYYFIMHLAGGVSLLLGILINYSATGSMAITTVEHGLVFFVIAVAIKLAFIGLHTWMPQNYANAPFHVSVVLSAFTTKAGVFAMYLLLGNVFLGYAGVISAILGVLMALKQTNVRKLLSYHIISQIGYMIAGIGVGTSLGIAGGMMHLFNHILYKGLLFMSIGSVIYCTDKEDLINLGGLAKKLPFTTISCLAASLAIAGMPFFNGYISKLVIKNGIEELGTGLTADLLIWGLLIAGVGTALSFIKVMYFGFFREVENPPEVKKKPPLVMKLGMGIILVFMLLLGFVPQLHNLLGGFEFDINFFSLGYIWDGFMPILVALIIFKLAHDIIEPHEHDTSDFDIYVLLAKTVKVIGAIFSGLQNGDLSRYLLWAVSSLAILWTFLLT